jgi:hypothetical protein
MLKGGTKIHRQGEFFFTPEPSFKPEFNMILKNEPMRSGGGHFHYAQFLYRSGGRAVYVRGNDVLAMSEYNKLARSERRAFVLRQANATVHVKGKITHIEHATCDLGDMWHLVHTNTETRNTVRGIRTGNLFID